MKKEERQEARRLRSKGMAIGRIAKLLNVSKGSVSVWVRDIELTDEQKYILQERIFANRKSFIAHGKKQALKNRKDKEERLLRWSIEAKKDFNNLSSNKNFVYGLGLYAGEGHKTGHIFSVTNTDPNIIRLVEKYIKIISPNREIVLRVKIHPSINKTRATSYWQSVIPNAKLILNVYEDKRTNAFLLKRGNYNPNGIATIEARKSYDLLYKTSVWIDMINNMGD